MIGHSKTIEESKNYFCNLHDVTCNQKYDVHPYSYHLNRVVNVVDRFIDLVNNNCTIDESYDRVCVYISAYGHDSIEDARVTYNDIKEKYGPAVAEIIYLCTDFKGRTRSERKPDQYYKELRKNRLALFVKLCDLISNIEYSIDTGSSMTKKYNDEYHKKIALIYRSEFKPMFDYIEMLFTNLKK